MTLAGIDSELAQWDDRQRLIEQNLKSFSQLPIFQGLNSQSFDGQTRQRLEAAVEVFRDLRQQQGILAATLERARVLRASLPRLMPARHTLEEIGQILNGPSIQLESSPTPPARRELLRDVAQDVRVSPARFLEIMLDSFRFVRDTMVGVESAGLENAQALEKQRDELSGLRQLSISVAEHPASELDAATQLLSELTALSGHDPLAAASRIPSLAAQIQGQRVALEAASRNRQEIEDHLGESDSLVDQVRGMHDRARRAFTERELKIQSPRDSSVPQPSGDGEVETLVAWLLKLRVAVQNGEYGPVAVGLKKWNDSATAVRQ